MSFWNKSIAIKVARTDPRAELPRKNHSNKFADVAYDLFVFDTSLPLSVYSIVKAAKPVTFDESIYVDQPIPGSEPDPDRLLTLRPGQRLLVGTGIRLAIPDGYWVKFHERSGLANKGIHVLGGVIDSGYTGELKVILYNSSNELFEQDYKKAIAQFTVEKVTQSELELISEDDMSYQASLRERKDKGFGSSDGK